MDDFENDIKNMQKSTPKNIHVAACLPDSIHGEKDVIILLCENSVAKTEKSTYWHHYQKQQMILALTRARHSLWIVGNFVDMIQDEDLACLVKNLTSRCLILESSNFDRLAFEYFCTK